MLKRPAMLCASLIFAAGLIFGLVRLFELRFDQGNIYPPYSTLRTDPLGTSVLYESLESVPGMTSQRYFDATFKNDDGPEHAYFVLGAKPDDLDWLPRSEFDTLQRFVYNGGRVVIAYYPKAYGPAAFRLEDTNDTEDASTPPKRLRHHPAKPAAPEDDDQTHDPGTGTNPADRADEILSTNGVQDTNVVSARPKHGREARRHQNDQAQPPDEDENLEDTKPYANMNAAWGFELQYQNLETNDDGELEFPKAERITPAEELPAALTIHTALCFTNLTNGWMTIYQRDRKTPVIVERKFGAGSVVLIADAYPFSNEAMFKDRNAPLLAWVLGSGRDLLFDEAHLGIVEQPGMATLMRRYRLHGLIFSLLLVAGLFVWKNSLALVPPHSEPATGAGPVVAGRGSAAGFVNLVRRSVAPAEIINLCYAEWKKSSARTSALSPAQRRDLEQLIHQQAALEPNRRKPVENYRVISQILQRRK